MKIITVNKKAWYDYEIMDKFEAGMVLEGSEVKAIREGKVNLKDAYVDVKVQGVFLIKAHIGLYSNASYNNHEPERSRKLLLHKREMLKLDRRVKTRGITIIPLRMYFNDKGKVKIEIAIVKGKRQYEKRDKIREKDVSREVDRDLKHFKR